MRKSWKRFWFVTAVTLAAAAVSLVQWAHTAEWAKLNFFLSENFTYANSPIRFVYETLQQQEGCELEFDHLYDIDFEKILEEQCPYDRKRRCVVLMPKTDLSKCPVARAAIDTVLKDPCGYIVESPDFVKQVKAMGEDTLESLYREFCADRKLKPEFLREMDARIIVSYR